MFQSFFNFKLPISGIGVLVVNGRTEDWIEEGALVISGDGLNLRAIVVDVLPLVLVTTLEVKIRNNVDEKHLALLLLLQLLLDQLQDGVELFALDDSRADLQDQVVVEHARVLGRRVAVNVPDHVRDLTLVLGVLQVESEPVVVTPQVHDTASEL